MIRRPYVSILLIIIIQQKLLSQDCYDYSLLSLFKYILQNGTSFYPKMILKILYAVSLLDGLAFAIIVTSMTPYVISIGGSQFYLGVLGSVTAAINLIWSPILGSLSDTIGRKKALFQCLLVCIVGNALAPISSSLTIYFISRIFTSFGTQIMTLLKSLIDDNIEIQESKMAAIHKMQAFAGMCFIIGPLITGYFSELESGYNYIFGLVSAMYGINFVLISLIDDKQKKHTNKSKTRFNMLSEVKKAATKLTNVNWPKYWDLYTVKLIVDFQFAVFHFVFVQILMQRFGITGKSFGYVFASLSIISIVTSLSLSRLQKKFYSNDKSGLQRLLHGSLLMIYSCLGQGLSTNFVLYYLHLIPMTIGRVILDTTFTEVILERASPQEKGSIMGTFETTLSIGGLIAPIISGIISDIWGNESMILLCIIPLTFGSVLAYSQTNKISKIN